MNDLELPPRRTLPPEVRDRIRTTANAETPRPRYRAPLSVAAAVAVLAAAAVIVGQPSDSYRPATPPSSTGATVPGSDPALTVSVPDAQSNIDLDRCWVAIEAGQRTAEYAPRSAWQPVFTVTRARPGAGVGIQEGSLVRVTAFRDPGGRPGFCEAVEVINEDPSKRSWMATVSDPSAEPIPLATGINGEFFNTGLLAGVAEGVDSLEFAATNPHPDTGEPIRYECPPVLYDGLFLVEVGGLHVPGSVEVTGFDGAGNEVVSGEWTYDPAKDPMRGPYKIID